MCVLNTGLRFRSSNDPMILTCGHTMSAVGDKEAQARRPGCLWCWRCGAWIAIALVEQAKPAKQPSLLCDHKFIDSKHCLKCGWEPNDFARAMRAFDLFTLAERRLALQEFARLQYVEVEARFFEAVYRVIAMATPPNIGALHGPAGGAPEDAPEKSDESTGT